MSQEAPPVRKIARGSITLRAFRRDPLVTCSKDDADKLLRTMIANTKKYLPEGWQKISLNP